MTTGLAGDLFSIACATWNYTSVPYTVTTSP